MRAWGLRGRESSFELEKKMNNKRYPVKKSAKKYYRWFRRKLHRLYLKRVRMVEREIGEDLAVC